MSQIEKAYKTGMITKCRYDYLMLAYRVQNSGLKGKEAAEKFCVCTRTILRLLAVNLSNL
jgi:hypothetical protein